MTATLLCSVIATILGVASATQDPLSQCSWMSNPKLAPFIYLSQSEVAVLAHYAAVDHNAFRQRQQTQFFITPVCYIKGYYSGLEINIWSGFQKCPVKELSSLMEFPSLFFLRRNHTNNKWILLNGGEYQHQVDTSGLLFGVDRSVQDFPELCGLKRERIPVDQNRCDSGACKAYCDFRVASPNECKSMRELMGGQMKATDVPKDVAPFDGRSQPAFTKSSQGGNGGADPGSNGDGTRKTTKDNSGEGITYAPDAKNPTNKVHVTGKGGNSGSSFAPLASLLFFVPALALCHSR